MRGEARDVLAAQEFFTEKFKCVARPPSKQAHIHYMNMTDSEQVRGAMKSVHNVIMEERLYNIQVT